MKFTFLFLGKTREEYLEKAIGDYAERLGRFVPTNLVVLKEKHSKKGDEETIKRKDGEMLLDASNDGSYRVALDPRGKQPDSEELAEILAGWEKQNIRSVSFLIGGHLGLHETVIGQADLLLSLSRLTFTHEMSRFILLEQLYRACTIKAGHNYHK
ncbi:MAG: 23S rRNA (pseudouridine(1915)-N(3))-methyltransferase RlmH [Desulfobulbaceae bacterium]|nr:23S rRNA (pseudouridine(1915)-N(3))-methyltransferase RlmH [Desulfobulbaceae bacterium]